MCDLEVVYLTNLNYSYVSSILLCMHAACMHACPHTMRVRTHAYTQKHKHKQTCTQTQANKQTNKHRSVYLQCYYYV